MRTRSSEEIVINGVRYNLSIRLETRWSYQAEWWNNSECHESAAEDRSASEAEEQASDEIHKARLSKEPWLCAEIARADGEEVMLKTEPMIEIELI
jgi:hypothetical protein